MHRASILQKAEKREAENNKITKRVSGARGSIQSAVRISLDWVPQDKTPLRQRASIKSVSVKQETEKPETSASEALAATKTKFKDLIQQKAINYKYSMREMETLLKEQAAQRKALEGQNTSTAKLKMNIEDRYSDEEDGNKSRELENGSVRMLERWQLDNKKKRYATSMDRRSESVTRTIKQSTQDPFVPNISQEVMNAIVFTDDEQERVRNFFKRKLSAELYRKSKRQKEEEEKRAENAGSESQLSANNQKLLKGGETQKRDANKDILNDMVFRKINAKDENLLKGEPTEDLKTEVKQLVQQNLHNFQALKGIMSTSDSSNMEALINFLLKKKIDYEKLTAFEQESSNQVNGKKETHLPLLDYKAREAAILKKFRECETETKNIREKIAVVNQESLDLRATIKQIASEKQETLKKYENIEKDILHEKHDKGHGAGRRKAAEKSNLEEYMKLQKIRADKKKQETEFNERMEEFEVKIRKQYEILDFQEGELRNMKQLKAYYKLQIKELYHQTLQSESFLLHPENFIDYISVIISAWDIREEIAEDALASFVDKETASYMIQYAKLLKEWEFFCKENGMPSALETFEDLFHEGAAFRLPNINLSQGAMIDRSQLYATNKDIHELIDDVKSRMHLIKKSEIKAKRYLPMRSPHKLREKLVREEMVNLVDPAELENRISYRDQGGASTLRSNNISIDNRDQSQLFMDQASEIVKRLNGLKKEEIDRLFKMHLSKRLDERLKEALKKVFRYAFGKKDAEELFARFVKEKKMLDKKLQKTFGVTDADKQSKQNIIGLMRNASLKGLNSERNSVDQKSSNRESLRNASLPPLEHSRSSISIRKDSFASHNESVLKP